MNQQKNSKADQLTGKPALAIHTALLDFGGHTAVAVALASFGAIVLDTPAFNLSSFAATTLKVVCYGGAGVWMGLAIEFFYKRVVDHKLAAIVFAALALTVGLGAVASVIEYNKAARVASICERVEHIEDHPLAGAPRCRYYYSIRATSESKLIRRDTQERI